MEHAEVRSTLVSAIKTNSLLKVLEGIEFEELRTKDSVVAEELAKLHNSQALDLNQQLLNLTKQENRYNCSSLTFAYCSALPKLDTFVIDIVNVFIHLRNEELVYGDFEQPIFCFANKV